MQIRLSGRMERLASMVTEGYRLADVGTDHGYIPIALILRGRIPSAIALDVNRGPLERAAQHIRERGLDTYVKTRLSDGLAGLRAGEADTVLIAGMGGALTVRILQGGSHCRKTVKEWILQPQSEIWLVRGWLAENGFSVIREDIVLDGGKYYPMMAAVYDGLRRMPKDRELYYGQIECQQSKETLEAYVRRGLQKNADLLAKLSVCREKQAERNMELLKEEHRLKAVLRCLAEEAGR